MVVFLYILPCLILMSESWQSRERQLRPKRKQFAPIISNFLLFEVEEKQSK